jgi:hypothetical protein
MMEDEPVASECRISEAFANVVRCYHHGSWKENSMELKRVMEGLSIFMSSVPAPLMQEKELAFLESFCKEINDVFETQEGAK